MGRWGSELLRRRFVCSALFSVNRLPERCGLNWGIDGVDKRRMRSVEEGLRFVGERAGGAVGGGGRDCWGINVAMIDGPVVVVVYGPLVVVVVCCGLVLVVIVRGPEVVEVVVVVVDGGGWMEIEGCRWPLEVSAWLEPFVFGGCLFIVVGSETFVFEVKAKGSYKKDI